MISEEAPSMLVVKQGSVWGTSPKAAKKVIDCRFSSLDAGTRVSVSSRLSSDWRNLAVAGIVLSVVVAVFCLWIGLDLRFWSWIVTGSSAGLVLANLLAKLSVGLAVFLTVVNVMEVFVMFHANRKVDAFAIECLKSLG